MPVTIDMEISPSRAASFIKYNGVEGKMSIKPGLK
jgi:hypothetical protein